MADKDYKNPRARSKKKRKTTLRTQAEKAGLVGRKAFDRVVLAHDRLQTRSRMRHKKITAARELKNKVETNLLSKKGSPMKLKMDYAMSGLTRPPTSAADKYIAHRDKQPKF